MKNLNLKAHANRGTRDKKTAIKHGDGKTLNSFKDQVANHTSFSAKLVLSYPPLSNYEFVKKRDDSTLKKFLCKSMLYVIVQREELTFENIQLSTKMLSFKIKKKERKKNSIAKYQLYRRQLQQKNYH